MRQAIVSSIRQLTLRSGNVIPDSCSDIPLRKCFGCGGLFPEASGATHKYMLSTAGCWSSYGDLLVREYESPVLFGAVHRLTVDAYALQHPGDIIDRRAIQSVWVHYAALYLAFEQKRPLGDIPPVMQKLAGGSFPPLPTIAARFAVTHADVIAGPVDNHAALVRDWAYCAYDAWSALNQPTKSFLNRVGL